MKPIAAPIVDGIITSAIQVPIFARNRVGFLTKIGGLRGLEPKVKYQMFFWLTRRLRQLARVVRT